MRDKVHEIDPQQGFVKIEFTPDVLQEVKDYGLDFNDESFNKFYHALRSPDGFFSTTQSQINVERTDSFPPW